MVHLFMFNKQVLTLETISFFSLLMPFSIKNSINHLRVNKGIFHKEIFLQSVTHKENFSNRELLSSARIASLQSNMAAGDLH